MAWKRVFDLVVGTLALVPIVLMLLVLLPAVLVTSGWPPLLVQTRVGAHEHPIRVVKIRTMRRGAPLVAKSLLERSADLYTPLGPLLRRLSLDELPQIVNVLRGDMSLVGPRPALPTQHDLVAMRRAHSVAHLKPGITGLAQVLGREDLTLSTKVRAEALYARRLSLCLDLRVIAWTAKAVLLGRGAF